MSELDYNLHQIKKLTPYLDDIQTPSKHKGKYNKLNIKHRAFAWYYVYNSNIKSDAYRRAFFPGEKEQEEFIKKNKGNKTETSQLLAVISNELYRRPYILEAVERIRSELYKNIKLNSSQSIIEQLQIQATYDPFMFFDTEGNFRFNSVDEIPKEFRCCIEQIETRYYGHDAQRKKTNFKLVNRENARKELMKLVPHLFNPEKIELIHKTIDGEGNETGIDYSNYTVEVLERKLFELKQRSAGDDE